MEYEHGELCRFSGTPSRLVQNLPYYDLVEKDNDKHWEWRKHWYTEAARDKALQKQLRIACSQDFLFFCNFACWILEPRKGEEVEGMFPFNSWEHQDDVMAALAHYAGIRHIIGDKSRAQGASWMVAMLIVWLFVFRNNQILGMGSKNEETADDPSNPESLGWKIDFLLENLPVWLRPRVDRRVSIHTWQNLDNGSYLKAYAATAGIGRGGRYTLFFLDESAFFPAGSDTEAVHNLLETCNGVVMISTPNGMNNEHYKRISKPGPWLTVVLDWRDNPVQKRGLYKSVNNRLFLQDDDYWTEERKESYSFIKDGRTRSPWFDRKWFDHGEDGLYVDQELNREYQGSKGRPFHQRTLDKCRITCRPPMHTGMLLFDYNFPDYYDSIKWDEDDGGKMDLWVPLDNKNRPPLSEYCLGMDIATGAGGDSSSNSVIEIFDRLSKEQVGEYAANTVDPIEFAQLAIAVAYWLGHGEPTPYLCWEMQGPGVMFSQEVLRIGYRNIYYQPQGDPMRPYQRAGKRPGWHNSDVRITLSPLKSAMVSSEATFHSEALIEECGQYAFDDAGKWVHPGSKTARDGSSRGISHGDRVIAAAMALRAVDDRPAKHQKRQSRQGGKPVNHRPSESIGGRIERRNLRSRMGKSQLCRW